MWDYAHYTFMAVYLAFSIPMMAVFVARRHQEPIKSRAWDLALTSAVYGAFMVVCMAIAAELNIANDATPCNLVIWPFAPFTCFFLNVSCPPPPDRIGAMAPAAASPRPALPG